MFVCNHAEFRSQSFRWDGGIVVMKAPFFLLSRTRKNSFHFSDRCTRCYIEPIQQPGAVNIEKGRTIFGEWKEANAFGNSERGF